MAFKEGDRVFLARTYTWRGDPYPNDDQPRPGEGGTVSGVIEFADQLPGAQLNVDWDEASHGIGVDAACLDLLPSLPDLTNREEVEEWLQT